MSSGRGCASRPPSRDGRRPRHYRESVGTAAPSCTITAVIPVRNRADVLERALESVRTQERPPDEVVVVDDGSTDGSAELVDRRDVRLVRLWRSGVSTARNEGVAASSAEFVAFLDSDDVWDAGHLRRMAAAIEATDGSASLYFSDIDLDRAHEQASLWTLCGFSIHGWHRLCERDEDWLFAARQPIMIPASVVRRGDYLAVGGSEPRLTRRSDTHLIFKLGLTGAICAVAGSAGIVHESDVRSLTRTYPADDPVYLDCTTWLYADLLRRFDALSRGEKRVLQKRLGAAHLSLARRRLTQSPLAAVSHLRAALRHNPAGVARRAGVALAPRPLARS